MKTEGKADGKSAGRPYPSICRKPVKSFGEAGYLGYKQRRGKIQRGSTAI